MGALVRDDMHVEAQHRAGRIPSVSSVHTLFQVSVSNNSLSGDLRSTYRLLEQPNKRTNVFPLLMIHVVVCIRVSYTEKITTDSIPL